MLRLFKSKLFLLLLITVVVLAVMGVTTIQGNRIGWISNIISVPLAPFQKLFTFAGQKADNGISYFKDMEKVKKENEELRKQIDKLESENRELIGYRQENKELREALSLKDQFEEYDFLGANIISKDTGNWFNVFSVDRGTKDGVGSNFAVITSKGLVGRVSTSDLLSSRVISIIDLESTVFVRLSKTSELAVLKGDITLKEQGLCRLDYISPDANIAVGDYIETSGLGGIYPKGITIGRVKEVRRTSSELNRYAIIEPAVNFKTLDEVFILKHKADAAETGSVGK